MSPNKQSQRAVGFTDVRKLALELPNVEDATSPRGVGFKLGGRLLACEAIHKSAEPDSLMVRVSLAQRAQLLAELPHACYVTPHYVNHPAVLVRLARIDREALRNVLGAAWVFVSEKAVNSGARSAVAKQRVRAKRSTRKQRRTKKD